MKKKKHDITIVAAAHWSEQLKWLQWIENKAASQNLLFISR